VGGSGAWEFTAERGATSVLAGNSPAVMQLVCLIRIILEVEALAISTAVRQLVTAADRNPVP
jgi:hypothetical protein